MRSHLRSPDEMNWSNTTCAPLAKSPNCASQSVSAFGSRQRVAVLEAEHRLFREHRIDDFVARLRRREIVQAGYSGFRRLIVEHRVALREGAALEILAGQADRVAVEQEAPKASASAVAQSSPSPDLDHAWRRFSMKRLDRPVRVEILRHFGQLLADFLQRLHRNGGLAAALLICIVGGAQAGPCAIQPVGLVRLVVPGRPPIRSRDARASRPSSSRIQPSADQPFGDQLVAHRAAPSSCASGWYCT